MNLIKTVLFTLLVPGAVAGLLPYLLIRSPLRLPVHLGDWRLAGLFIMTTGAAFYLWTASDFVRVGEGTPAPTDAPRILVKRGLYSTIRNPMYIGILTLLVGEAIYFESVLLLIYAGLVFAGFHAFVVLYEEPALRRRFGARYETYRSEVPRWLPRTRYEE